MAGDTRVGPQDTCPACRAVARRTRLELEDDRGTFRLYRCSSCRTEFFRGVAEHATSSSYWLHKEFKFDMYASADVQADYEWRYTRVLDLAERFVGSPRSVVDVGCGIGNFVEFAQKRGMRSLGVDVDERAVAAARARGLSAMTPNELDAAIPAGSVQIGTLWDVIEHVEDPSTLVGDLLERIEPGGLLLLETPDARFVLRPVARWLYHLSSHRIRLVRRLYYSEHRIYFTVTGLTRLLESLGCEILAVRKLTSPRAKMASLFARSAEAGSLEGRVLRTTWPYLEALTRRLGFGNKIILVARKRATGSEADAGP